MSDRHCVGISGVYASLLYPWETGTCASVFTDDFITSLPECVPGMQNDLEESAGKVAVGDGPQSVFCLDADLQVRKRCQEC